ncbi:uncharacterized protein [Choristoneura fumiferana]|uniref:uncharacterized protein n=1 Tax=Choristoneura fumiferana TaxID=7141 RepID=UPI003D1544CE
MEKNKLLCSGCKHEIADGKFLKCCICELSYDLLCANIAEKLFINSTPEQRCTWKCVKCVSGEPRTDNTNTPARGSYGNINLQRGAGVRSHSARLDKDSAESAPDVDMSLISLNDTVHDLTLNTSNMQTLIAEIRQVREEVRQVREDVRVQLQNLSGTVSSIATRLDVCDTRIDDLVSRIETIERWVETKPERQTEGALADTVLELKAELNEREQELLHNDIEISCIPEQSGESILHIVTAVGQKLGLTLVEHDIVSAHRVGRILETVMDSGKGVTAENAGNVLAPSATPPRPRLIVVRLARRVLRDQLLKEARVRRGVTTEGIGLPGTPRPFYINERLTRVNRVLFQKTRKCKEIHGWRYAWTRDGKIYVRQRSGIDTPKCRIRTENDLMRVFGTSTVCF